MERRDCIKAGILAAASLTVAKANFVLASNPMKAREGIRKNLGIALYTVHTLMPEKLDLDILKQIAEIGYKEVELFDFSDTPVFINDPLFGNSPKAFKQIFNDAGLSIPSAQLFVHGAENIGPWAELANELGIKYLIEGMAPEFIEMVPDGPPIVSGVKDLDQIERIAERLNNYGEVLKKYGMGFAYHNHHMEFEMLAGETAFDHLLKLTDPDLVKIELDVGWAQVAGANSANIIARYKDRIIALHLKDHDPDRPLDAKSPIPEGGQIATPGDGIVDYAALFEEMDRHGIKHGFVEVDFPKDPMDTTRRGYNYLNNLKRPA